MKTRVIVCLAMLGITSTSFAQRHFERGNDHRERSYNHDSRSYHGQARHTVIIAPAPRVVFRQTEPVIVIEHNNNRRYNEPNREFRNRMTDDDFCQINRRLQNMMFESDKIEYIKDKIDFYFVTSSQVSDLLYNITFESNRLDLAKYAFQKTIDPQNYSLVYNTLDFESSKRNLDYFIDNQRICKR